MSIWFYAYRVSTQKSLTLWALYCGQYRAQAWFYEERYRLLEITRDEDMIAFTGKMDGPFEIWSWPLDGKSPELEVQAYVDGFNTEMRRLWQKAQTQTNVPNQSVETNALHGWQRW